MAYIDHKIHIFQRPAQGTSFIKRYSTYNYQHTISAQGWFDTASCDIAVTGVVEAQQILEQYLGCFVQIFVDNPKVPIWEGIVNRMTFNNGGASYTIGLDEMANRVNVIYTGGSNVAAATTSVDNTASQAIYGIKHDQIEFGADPSAGTGRTVLANTILAQRAFPQSSYGQNQGNANLVHLELLGVFHTLEWTKFFTALTTATSAASTRIGVLIGVDFNANTFYDNTNLNNISVNATTVNQQARGQSIWEAVQKIAEIGDSADYWIAGITPTDPNIKTRALYYRKANSTIVYTARQSENLRPRSLYGGYVAPWNVVPDAGIRVTDVLVGYGGTIQTSPREAYIQSIQYDANSQNVQWFGTDDTTARGAFMLKRSFKPISRSFGAPLRTLAT